MDARNLFRPRWMLLAVAWSSILLRTGSASGSPITIESTDFAVKLEVLRDLPLATPLRLHVNVKVGDGPIVDVDFTFTSGATDVPAADIAAMLAAAINDKAGANTVSVTGTTITLVPEHSGIGTKTADTDRGYLQESVSLAQLLPNPTPVLLGVGPDPNTGSFVAISPGTIALTGPDGLNAVLGIGVGTSGLDIATLFATTLISAGYDVNQVGANVFLGLPSPGTFSLRADGTGLEYTLADASAIPEPASITLLGTGTVWLMLRYGSILRRRRP